MEPPELIALATDPSRGPAVRGPALAELMFAADDNPEGGPLTPRAVATLEAVLTLMLGGASCAGRVEGWGVAERALHAVGARLDGDSASLARVEAVLRHAVSDARAALAGAVDCSHRPPVSTWRCYVRNSMDSTEQQEAGEIPSRRCLVRAARSFLDDAERWLARLPRPGAR